MKKEQSTLLMSYYHQKGEQLNEKATGVSATSSIANLYCTRPLQIYQDYSHYQYRQNEKCDNSYCVIINIKSICYQFELCVVCAILIKMNHMYFN